MPPVAGRHLSAASGGGRNRRLRARRSGRGRKTLPCRRTVPLADGLACGRTPPIVKAQGRSWGTGAGHWRSEARVSRHRQ